MFFHEVTRSVIFISTEDLRFKIEDILLLFLQFTRRCSTVDPIVSKKIPHQTPFHLKFVFFFYINHIKETDPFFFVPAGFMYTGDTLGMHSKGLFTVPDAILD